MEVLSSAFDTWVRQLIAVLAAPAIVGVLLFLSEYFTLKSLKTTIGWKGVLWWTGWLGTPVHEISHCLVGLAFGYRVVELKLFEPHPKDGVLGYVRFAKRQNPGLAFASKFGDFFIGIAPLFGGALVLFLLLRILVQDPSRVMSTAETYANTVGRSSPSEAIQGFAQLVKEVYLAVFSWGALDVRPWIFLYMALAIGAHLAPSPTDMKVSLAGIIFPFAALFLVDLIAIACNASPASLVSGPAHATAHVTALLIFALTLNLGNLIISFLVSRVVLQLRGERR